MVESLSVGIVVPSNSMGGPQKISAIMAADLAREGHSAAIFVPVLPHYFYQVNLGKRPIHWLKYVSKYVKDWAFSRNFFFQELLEDAPAGSNVRFSFVPRSASRRQLRGLDYLILHSIAQVSEYENKFPQERQIYLIHHLEEHDHGSGHIFRQIRQSFRGKIIAVSPFTARDAAMGYIDPPVVVNPISPGVWTQRKTFDPKAMRRDVLLFWKDYSSGLRGSEIVQELQAMVPEITVTVWCRGSGNRVQAQRALPRATIVEKLNEKQLIKLYREHSFLLFCSTFEGFGMPPIEALACGCIPVIDPKVGAAELYARDGQNTVFLEDDSRAVALKLANLLRTKTTLTQMRSIASTSIEPFNPNRYGHRVLAAAGVL